MSESEKPSVAHLLIGLAGLAGLGIAFVSSDGHAVAGAIVFAAVLFWGEIEGKLK